MRGALVVVAGIAFGFAAPSAGGAHSPCTFKVATPAVIQVHFISGRATIVCSTPQRKSVVRMLMQLREGSRWVTESRENAGNLDPYPAHHAFKFKTAAGCRDGTWRTVATLSTPHHVYRGVSREADLKCAGQLQAVSCDVQAAEPQRTPDGITGSATFTCSGDTSVDIQLSVELYSDGAWNPYGGYGQSGVPVKGGQPTTFTTRPSPCPPQPQQLRTTVTYAYYPHSNETKTSGVVELSC